MKFIKSILLISAAFATITSAAPLGSVSISFSHSPTISSFSRRNDAAVSGIVKLYADHYSEIAQASLDNLLAKLGDPKVTSGTKDLPKERYLLRYTIEEKIKRVKKDCSSEAIASSIEAAISVDIAPEKMGDKAKAEKTLAALDIKVEKLISRLIRDKLNAKSLSKDCTEKMTGTQIAPAEDPLNDGSVETEPEAPEVLEDTPEFPEDTPAPDTDPVPKAPAPKKKTSRCSASKSGINTCGTKRYVCKSGCNNDQDAKVVLDLRANLENELQPRLSLFFNQEIPTACADKSPTLLDNVLSLLNL